MTTSAMTTSATDKTINEGNDKTSTAKDFIILSAKLSNQRTYISYLGAITGLSAIAVIYKSKYIPWIVGFMCFGTFFQYIFITYKLNKDENPYTAYLDYIPLLYSIVVIFVFKSKWDGV